MFRFPRPSVTPLSAALAASLLASAAFGATDVPPGKQTGNGLYLTATEAAEMLVRKDVVFIDVRSRPELYLVGLPKRVDVNIPLMVVPEAHRFEPGKGRYRMRMNPDFVYVFETYMMEQGHDENTQVVLICRSGGRSAKAANILREMGYANVWTVIDGFEGDKAKAGPQKGARVVNGWRNAGLDWSYAIRAGQVYPPDRAPGN